MSTRLNITKTHKLFIKGAFPRSESGRSIAVTDASGHVVAHVPQGSRKDLRDAVVAARGALDGWSARSAYNRGQILYRMAEMLEGKGGEFAEAIEAMAAVKPRTTKKKTTKKAGARAVPKPLSPDAEVDAAVDRLVAYAGWADKFSQVLGCHNMVNGPYYNFTVAEATGVTAVVAPDGPALLGLVSLIAPVICSGGTVVALASEREPITACIFGEVCATSDVPAGVVNILTGHREELVPQVAGHRDIDAIHAANLPKDQGQQLRDGGPDSIKRVRVREVADWTDVQECESPWWIEPFVEMKTIWHPAAS
ncbi:MAG: aldehyde dehydrogenase family protein [Phycisphaerales bacterium]|nr:aldehyde dehydrogenase family protein [Phycisphaerales bacterium]